MLAWIIYSLGTFLLGLFLTLVLSFFSGGPTKRAEKPFKLIICCLAVCMCGPFAYVEALTLIYGKKMEHAINLVYNDAPVNGPMQYFKITSCHGDKASAYVVGKEHYGGMDDRPIIQVMLVKQDGQWKGDTYHVVSSAKLDKDELTFPPYE